MTDAKQPMESPSGLELHPEPPPTARISKKVGVAVLGVVVVVGVLVVYGLYARREQQQVAQTKNEEKHPESARSIGDQLVKELAPPAVANPAPVFSGRTGLDPAQVNGGTQAPTQVALQPPGLVYRDDGKEGRSEARGAGDESHSVHWRPYGTLGGREAALGRIPTGAGSNCRAYGRARRQFGLPGSPHAAPLNDALQQFGPLASLLGAGKALVEHGWFR